MGMLCATLLVAPAANSGMKWRRRLGLANRTRTDGLTDEQAHLLALFERVDDSQDWRMFETRRETNFITQHVGDDLTPARLVQFLSNLLLEDEHRRFLHTPRHVVDTLSTLLRNERHAGPLADWLIGSLVGLARWSWFKYTTSPVSVVSQRIHAGVWLHKGYRNSAALYWPMWLEKDSRFYSPTEFWSTGKWRTGYCWTRMRIVMVIFCDCKVQSNFHVICFISL